MLRMLVLLTLLTAVPLAAAAADPGNAPAPDPGQLLDRMAARYAGCTTLRLDGEITHDEESLLDLVGRYVARGRMQPFFMVEFSRRGQSRFVFTDPDGTRLETRGSGNGAVSVDSRAADTRTVTSWSEELNVLDGQTSGASSIVGELLFGPRGENSILSLSNLQVGGAVKLGRVQALVVHGRTPKYAVTLWIARDDARLLRVERTVNGAAATTVTIDFIERILE
jgi:hypothetical protein